MREISFVGRQRELKILRELLDKRAASLVVLKGRRRIGKSRLTQEFGKALNTFFFEGLPPDAGTTGLSQREDFARQMERQLKIPAPRAEDWGDLFWTLAHHTQEGRVLIILDEITWLGAKDPTFLGKLKNAWDLYFKKNPELILILTGSMSGWIEKNILSSTGFFGRITLDMTLEELPLSECSAFWNDEAKGYIAPYEKFKVLSVTGGVPRYLEEILPHLSAEENIERLCFRKEGLLFREFDHIFSDLFSRRGDTYKEIIKRLASGSATLNEICSFMNLQKSGVITEYLDDLVKCGFVSRDYSWKIISGTLSKLSCYRLSDNYLRFYLKVILPLKSRIERGDIKRLPNWESVMGLQFENLILHNRHEIYQLLGIELDEIVFDNPYFQKNTQNQKGCQIDYLVQTRTNTLYVCEVKMRKRALGVEVIDEMKAKIDALEVPKGFGICPVLFFLGPVTDGLLESRYFYRMIDIGEFLNPSPD